VRILVADDDEILRRTLSMILRRWGHHVVSASSGAEALELLTAPDPPRVAVLDWLMPGMSGLEVCRTLRQDLSRPYTYVILLSGRSERVDRLEGLEAGADEYLVKPFDSREIEARLRTAERVLSLDRVSEVRPRTPLPDAPVSPAGPADTLELTDADRALHVPLVGALRGRSHEPAEVLQGRVIGGGKYELTDVVGSGSSGVVYRARHTALDRQVAIKILHPLYQVHPSFVGRFEREARATSKLDHEHITRVLDFGREPDGLLYLVMEFVEGETLDALLRREGKLPSGRALDIVAQVLGALSAAHEQGVVHRDVKPENIMIVRDRDERGAPRDRVKVCDFGLAKLTSLEESGNAEAKLTQVGTLCGTPQYMSPEQAAGGDVDARADLYACGVILYELVTGEVPFVAESPLALLSKHVFAAPEPPTRKEPSLSPHVEAVILRALAKDRERRQPSARAFREQLVALAGIGKPFAYAAPGSVRRVG